MRGGDRREPAIDANLLYLFSLFFLFSLSASPSLPYVLLLLLKGLEKKVAEAMHSILSDDKQGEWVALYNNTSG